MKSTEPQAQALPSRQKIRFMKKGFILWYFFSLAMASYGQAERLMGLVLDDEAYRNLAHVSQNIRIDPGRKSLAERIDLTPYCPEIQNQGEIASCVGWSVGYSAMTIERAVLSGWEDSVTITQNAHSALFIYNQIPKGSCKSGITIPDALNFIREKGNCLAGDFDFSIADCAASVSEELLKKAARFRISDFIPVFQWDADGTEKVRNTRLILSQRKPVVVGMEILRNFQNIKKGESRWMPGIGDKIYAGAHAMVVVGYDDRKFNGVGPDQQGAFKLMNSWGKNWGENGFIWVRYADFGQYCRHAFAIRLAEGAPLNLKSTEPATAASENELQIPENQDWHQLSGAFGFRHFTGWDQNVDPPAPVFEDARVQLKGDWYTLTGDWKPGDRFQLQVKSGFDNGYIYVLSVDDAGGANIHFPKSREYDPQYPGQNESALIPSGGSTLTIPSLTRTLTLEKTGKDHLIVLYSTYKIDPGMIRQICAELSGNPGEPLQTLRRMLEKDRIPSGDIAYRPNEMGFEVNTHGKGRIVPVFLEIEVNE